MSVYNSDDEPREAKLKRPTSYTNWKSPASTPKSPSTHSRIGEVNFNNYLDLIHSKSNISTAVKQEPLERPFDFFDDDEFQFGINLLNNNVACVGDNITKLVQMAQEPWPEDVKLFQPYEADQILLPDNASCLAVQAFLKMCNLPFEVEMRWNAEFMSPSGRVPFIKCGAFVVSELEPIVQFAANKGVSLCSRLTTEEKAEMRAYMSLIINVLVNAELYVTWLDDETFNTVTKIRNSSVYPWPLGWLQTRSKRNTVAKRLKALHWHEKTFDQVMADVEQCCNSLSQRLGDRDFFFCTPTPLDALVYGHVRAILCAKGPRAPLMIKPVTGALLRLIIKVTQIIRLPLTPQEDYLLNQAFNMSRHRYSLERTTSERSERLLRSRMSLKHQGKENLVQKDVFGFKPFASKQIIIMTSKEGTITCQYNQPRLSMSYIDPDNYNFVLDVIEDILDKVEEVVIDEFTVNIEPFNEKNDFEVIAFPSLKYQNMGKSSESMGLIDNVVDTTLSTEDVSDDVFQVINEEEEEDLDSDDKHLSQCGVEENEYIENSGSSITRKSTLNEDLVTPPTVLDDTSFKSTNSSIKLTNSSDKLQDTHSDVKIDDSKSSSSAKSSRFSSESQATLKMPSDEEISLEGLLNYLRLRNAAQKNFPIVADID